MMQVHLRAEDVRTGRQLVSVEGARPSRSVAGPTMVVRSMVMVVPVMGPDEVPGCRAIHVTTRTVDEERDPLDPGCRPVLVGGGL